MCSICAGPAMNGAGAARSRRRTRALAWLAVGAGLLLVLIANWHLVYVASCRSRTASRMCARAKAPRRREGSARQVIMHAAMSCRETDDDADTSRRSASAARA